MRGGSKYLPGDVEVGDRRSPSVSPQNLNANTVRKMAIPIRTEIPYALEIKSRSWETTLP